MAKQAATDEFIPLMTPNIGEREWEYVRECLKTHWVSYVGSYVNRFEENLARITGAPYCVATNSGTAALHLAMILFDVQPNTEVVMPAISFVAPANAVRYLGAWPTFIDIDPNTWQMNLSKLEHFLEEDCERNQSGALVNKRTARRVAALLPVHLLGGMVDVDAVAELATRFGLPLIEDAAECLGAACRGQAIGALTQRGEPDRRIVITSFNGNKIVTTGGGGALLLGDQGLAQRAKHISTTAKTDPIEFHHDVVGFNYRLSNVLAAIGVGQLELLDEYVQRKKSIANRYDLAFRDMDGVEIAPHSDIVDATYWMYTIRLKDGSRELVREMNQGGIQARPIWVPLHQLPEFCESSYLHSGDFAQCFYESAISLPCSVSLSEPQQDRVVEAVHEWLGR